MVGESWSGRAYELRAALGRCALPHSFFLADSAVGQEFVAKAADGRTVVTIMMTADPDKAINETTATPEMLALARATFTLAQQ